MIKLDTEKIIDKKFINIPYKFGGQSFDGADCMGIILLWYKEQGIVFDYDESTAKRMKVFWERRPAEFLTLVSQFGSFIPFHEIKKYDFLLFFGDGKDETFPSFPAVMVDDRYFLSNIYRTKSFTKMIDVDWKTRFWGAIKISKAVDMGIR